MSEKDKIETFLASYPAEVRDLAHAARRMLLGALPGSEETLDETARVIGFGYGPGYKNCVCSLIMSQKGVKVGIAYGATLPDPDRLLQGAGKVHRHVALKSIADLKQPGVKSLVKAALKAWKDRIKGDAR
jgi:hypothetical protein